MIPPDLSRYPPPPEGVDPCDECGMVHYTIRGEVSCKDHTSLGLPCRKRPLVEGHGLCGIHDSSDRLPLARRARKRRIAQKQAAKSLSKIKITPIGNPIDHLSDLAAEALAIKQHFADVVAELRQISSPTARVGGDDLENMELADFLNRRDAHGYRFTDDKGAEQLDARVALYERALERAEKFLVNLVKLDFEDKRIRLDEARVLLMMEFTKALVTGLGRQLEEPEVEMLIRSLSPILDGFPARTTPIIEAAEAS